MDARFLLADPDANPIIVRQPAPAELELAARRCGVGGAILVETRGTQRSVRGLERRLSRLGFTDITPYWHWPSFDRCTHIIPAASPAAVRYALSRVGSTRLERLRARLLRALSRTGIQEWTRRDTTIVARRPGGDASIVHTYLTDARWNEWSPGSAAPRSFVMLTPRFRSSSRVILLLLGGDAQEPALVVKLSRQQDPCVATEREAERMAAVHALRPAGFSTIPRPVATDRVRGREVLIERAMPGRAMDRSVVRRNATRCCEAILEWLLDVQLASRSPRSRTEVQRLLEDDLRELERLVPREEDLIRATRDLVRPLYEIDLVSVLEHGDLSHPNLLVDSHGRLSVLDWESVTLRGLPLADLVFAIAYVARAIGRVRSSADTVRAVERALVRETGWGRPYLRRYAEALGLPDPSVRPLFVASWVRQVAGWARRARSAETGADSRTRSLREDWRVDVWRHVVEQERAGPPRAPESCR